MPHHIDVSRLRRRLKFSARTDLRSSSSRIQSLTILFDSSVIRHTVIYLPCSIVCSTFRVNSPSCQGKLFKCVRNVRPWNSAGSLMMSLSAKHKTTKSLVEQYRDACGSTLAASNLWARQLRPCKHPQTYSMCCSCKVCLRPPALG